MARERHVYPTSEIAHLWAHRSKPDARNSQGNFYFQGDTIYSYGSHFPIARHIEHDGKKAILFVDHSYSNTTSKHVGNVRHSIPPGVPVFEVSDVRRDPKEAYASKRKDVDEQIEKLRLARPKNKYQLKVKTTKGKLTLVPGTDDNETAAILGQRLAMYLSGNVWPGRRGHVSYNVSLRAGKNAGVSVVTGLNRAEARIVLDILDSIPQKQWDNFEANRAKLAKKVDAARTVAKKQASVSRNPGSLAKAYNKLESDIIDLNRFADFFGGKAMLLPSDLNYLTEIALVHERRVIASRATANETRARKWAEQDAKAAKSFEEKLPRWLAGERISLGYYGGTVGGTDYLRVEQPSTSTITYRADYENIADIPELPSVMKDSSWVKAEVVTSRGARVPLDHVKKALPLVLSYVNNGRAFAPNGHTIRLGYYMVNSISEDGTLQVGCHTFSKAEILRFAGVLAAFEESAPNESSAPIIAAT